ncbi:MAG: PAS domain-containing protein [Microscillaceae bacterium]|nr:PAS domain-containing protein [Microscillaceae bacterium]
MVRFLEANTVLPSSLFDQLAEDGLRITAQRSLEKIYVSAFTSFQNWFINFEDLSIWLFRPGERTFEVWQAGQNHQSVEKKQVGESEVPSMGQDCFFVAKAPRWQRLPEGASYRIDFYQPIFFQQEILGFLSLRLRGGQIDPSQKQILQHLGLYVSLAIGHAQTYLALQTRNEEIIRQSQEFQSLIRVMPQSLFRTDTEGRLTFANQAFQQLIGTKLENLLGREAYSLYLPELGEIFKADDQWVMTHLENLEATRVLQTGPYAEPVFVQMVKSPILDLYNRIVGVQTIFWDVTEKQKNQDQLRLQKVEIRQQARKLTQMNRELEQKQREIKTINARLETEIQRQLNQIQRTREELDIFLYRASHDLRRPVTTLMGLAQVARLTLENEEAVQLFEKVDTTAQTMDQMLAKLLMVSEIHHASGLPQPIDLAALMEDLHQEYQELLQRNAIQWEMDIEASIQFTSFPNLLAMILRNLIENSVQFRRCDGAEYSYIKVRIYQKMPSCISFWKIMGRESLLCGKKRCLGCMSKPIVFPKAMA